MLLKRKRSESELGSVFSSTQRMDNGCFNFDVMSAMNTARRGFFAPRYSTPSHLHSRTKKRFRDSRPSEDEVYQHTLDVLYSAQRRPHELHPAPAQPPQTANTGIPSRPYRQSHHDGSQLQQRSLHSFWNLPGGGPATSSTGSPASSPASCLSPLLACPLSIPTHCEDCGAGLGGDGDDDTMMDIDGYGGSGLEDQPCCVACGKAVCFSCSISNLGEHRRCLACAGPRGGIGGTVRARRLF
ncbi:hypothetical protein N657DRAFT_571791 [Parathielavia appendiculata]|uniref:Uncharacterized protein n=1 Tax=Parathielavia appendiculata TaxID=2587402 RepID=A0AAN6Z4U7_9PEZI|nr:hypothetical protein N657DRAFT_571791 [Parathielavia appendiculata]